MAINKEQIDPQAGKTDPWSNVISKCWKPDCKNVATGRDGSGWEWCEEHFDQEKTGSVLHTKQEGYDFNFYQERVKRVLLQVAEEAEERARKETVANIEKIIKDIGEPYKTWVLDRDRTVKQAQKEIVEEILKMRNDHNWIEEPKAFWGKLEYYASDKGVIKQVKKGNQISN